MGPLKVTRSVALVVAFVFQLVLGSLGFLALYIAAALLLLAVGVINKWAAISAPWLLTASGYVEIGLFGLDLIAFGLFAISELAHFARALWHEWNDD